MTTNIKITKIGKDPFVADEKHPAKLIKEVKAAKNKDGKVIKNTFNIKIFHPNRASSEEEYKPLYDKNHRFDSIMEAMDRATELINTKFKDVETEYADIKHIPKYKKGKMDLNTKD